jgi:hypothetical protein
MSGWAVVPEQDETSKWKPVAAPQTDTGTIGPQPKGIGNTLENFESDIRTGGGSTMAGRALQALGAPGLNRGVSPETANYMGSPILGPTHIAQGAVETPSHPLSGLKKMGTGALETATIPSSFVSPEIRDAALAMPGKMIPNAKRAGQAIGEVEQAIGHQPIETAKPMLAVHEAEGLLGHGSPPEPLQAFSKRMATKFEGDQATQIPSRLTFGEGRNIYSAASDLTRDQMNSMTGKMGRQVRTFASELGNSLQEAANKFGEGEKYQQAMKEYHNAKTLGDMVDIAKKWGVRGAVGYGLYNLGGEIRGALGK